MKWGTKYPAHYVNRLRNMVARHLSHTHRFICFTDDGAGIDRGGSTGPLTEVYPLPDVAIPEGLPERGWRKLASFRDGLADLTGPTLFLDLDLVIVDRLDPFFEHPGEFCIIRDYRPFRRDRYVGNSSVYRFEAGAWGEIITHFEANFSTIRGQFRNEQEYLSHFVHERGALVHWPDPWCRSFKAHCMHKGPMGFFRVPRIPEGARIIVFHGHPHPDEAIEGRSGSWKRALRPTPWVADHWR